MYDLPPPKPFYYFVNTVAPFASIIKVPPKPVSTVLQYHELVCSEEDQGNIYTLISTIGEHNDFELSFKVTYLNELGAKVEHVHPLKFLGCIFSNSYLKSCMKKVLDDYFKRTRFLSDLSQALDIQADLNRLYIYLQNFADEIHVPFGEIEPFFLRRDWQNLMYYLVNVGT